MRRDGTVEAEDVVRIITGASDSPVVFSLCGTVLSGHAGALQAIARCDGFEIVRSSAGPPVRLHARLSILDLHGDRSPVFEEWHLDPHDPSWSATVTAAVTATATTLRARRQRDGATDSLVYGDGGRTLSWTRVAAVAAADCAATPTLLVWHLTGERLEDGYAALAPEIRAYVEAHRPEHAFAPSGADPADLPARQRAVRWGRRLAR